MIEEVLLMAQRERERERLITLSTNSFQSASNLSTTLATSSSVFTPLIIGPDREMRDKKRKKERGYDAYSQKRQREED